MKTDFKEIQLRPWRQRDYIFNSIAEKFPENQRDIILHRTGRIISLIHFQVWGMVGEHIKDHRTKSRLYEG